MKLQKHMALTKQDLKQIKDVVVEAAEPYFTAIKGDFNNIDDRFSKIDGRFDKIDGRFDKIESDLGWVKDKLSSLERRVFALEDIATEHGKELRKISRILTQLQKQRKVEIEKVVLLEKRITQLEAGVV